jgi:hypothetical protein
VHSGNNARYRGMKNISGTKKISVRAGTTDGDIYKTLIGQDAGAKKLLLEPGLVAYLMSDGSTLEIYGAGFCCPDYLFAHGNVVVSFKVDGLEQLVSQFEDKGALLLGTIENVCSSYRYCHLLTPEKTVIGLYEYPVGDE